MSSVSDNVKLNGSFFVIVGIVVACSVWASTVHPDWKPPADWLLVWTGWVGSVVGIVVAAKVFWAGGEAAKEYALKIKGERGK
jgi:hypothetical protein